MTFTFVILNNADDITRKIVPTIIQVSPMECTRFA